MKKIKVMRIMNIFLIVVLFSATVNAFFFNVTHECKDGVCIEGEKCNWYITFFNEARHRVEFTAIELMDAVKHEIISKVQIDFQPFTDNRGDVIIVDPTRTVVVNLSGVVQKANYQNRFIYYPCLTYAVIEDYIIAKYSEYEIRHCYDDQNFSMKVIECNKDENCRYDEYCNYQRCAKLRCGECQYPANNTCIDYECCDSESCNYGEKCSEHVCVSLNCKEDEYIENETCKKIECAYDEHIVDKVCRKLICKEDEYAINHTCEKLNCSYDEYIENHACASLECAYDEYAIDHSCEKLSCKEDEGIDDHSCFKLDCNFYQYIKDHKCVNNKKLIFKLYFELFLVIILIIFFILDSRYVHKEDNKKDIKKEEKNIFSKKVFKLEEEEEVK